MHGNEDFLYKLDLIFAYIKELLKAQQLTFSRIEEVAARLESDDFGTRLSPVPGIVWLTKADVMDYLCITESTFYRRQREGKWERRKSGGTWYYLQSSLI